MARSRPRRTRHEGGRDWRQNGRPRHDLSEGRLQTSCVRSGHRVRRLIDTGGHMFAKAGQPALHSSGSRRNWLGLRLGHRLAEAIPGSVSPRYSCRCCCCCCCCCCRCCCCRPLLLAADRKSSRACHLADVGQIVEGVSCGPAGRSSTDPNGCCCPKRQQTN